MTHLPSSYIKIFFNSKEERYLGVITRKPQRKSEREMRRASSEADGVRESRDGKPSKKPTDISKHCKRHQKVRVLFFSFLNSHFKPGFLIQTRDVQYLLI